MALQGSLTDFGIAEILQLIGTQQKTGILHVESERGLVQVSLSAGRVIRCDEVNRKDSLGARLVAAGLITKDQLADATRQNKKTNEPIEELLVAAGAIARELLAELTDLQTRESLYQLFEWKTGKYRFEGKPVGFTRPVVRPISPESLLMEGFRRLDEWPLIRTKVSNYEEVYRRLKTEEPVETEGEALERILDDAFGDFVEGPAKPATAPTTKGSRLTANDRKVLGLIDGKRTVYELIDRSLLGEFETCKSLFALLGEGQIQASKSKRAKENPRVRGGGALRMIAKGLGNLALIALVAVAVALMPRSRSELKENARVVAEEATARLRANRLVLISNALEVYRLEHGQYPDELPPLVEAGLLPPDALTAPGGRPFLYLSVGSDFDLR